MGKISLFCKRALIHTSVARSRGRGTPPRSRASGAGVGQGQHAARGHQRPQQRRRRRSPTPGSSARRPRPWRPAGRAPGPRDHTPPPLQLIGRLGQAGPIRFSPGTSGVGLEQGVGQRKGGSGDLCSAPRRVNPAQNQGLEAWAREGSAVGRKRRAVPVRGHNSIHSFSQSVSLFFFSPISFPCLVTLWPGCHSSLQDDASSFCPHEMTRGEVGFLPLRDP